MFPMAFVKIDLFDRGLIMEGGMQGMVGHSIVQVGGQAGVVTDQGLRQ